MKVISKKILLIGDVGVGKTSILTKYCNNYFPKGIEPTMGIEFKIKIIKRNNFNVKLQIWDTSGQEKFKSITQNYFRDADALLYVFDVTNKDGLKSVENWLKIPVENNKKNLIKILIGNKTDLKRRITRDSMKQFLTNNNMIQLFEISAKKDEKNISEMFKGIVDLLIKNEPSQNIINSGKNDDIEDIYDENIDGSGKCPFCIVN